MWETCTRRHIPCDVIQSAVVDRTITNVVTTFSLTSDTSVWVPSLAIFRNLILQQCHETLFQARILPPPQMRQMAPQVLILWMIDGVLLLFLFCGYFATRFTYRFIGESLPVEKTKLIRKKLLHLTGQQYSDNYIKVLSMVTDYMNIAVRFFCFKMTFMLTTQKSIQGKMSGGKSGTFPYAWSIRKFAHSCGTKEVGEIFHAYVLFRPMWEILAKRVLALWISTPKQFEFLRQHFHQVFFFIRWKKQTLTRSYSSW